MWKKCTFLSNQQSILFQYENHYVSVWVSVIDTGVICTNKNSEKGPELVHVGENEPLIAEEI